MSLNPLKLSLIFMVFLSLLSCKMGTDSIRGEGPIIEKEYPLDKPFDKVSTAAAWDAELIHSDRPRLVVRTQENVLSALKYSIRNNKLSISIKKHIQNTEIMEVKIYYQNLSDVKASSASSITSDDVFEEKYLHLNASSAGGINLKLKTENCSAKASSAGKITLTGTSINFKGRVSSGAEIDATALKTKNSDLNASSAGSMAIKVKDSLTVRTSSGGSIDYSGHPGYTTINRDVSGGRIR